MMKLYSPRPMLGLLWLILTGFSGCTYNSLTSTGAGVVTGSVAYRERIALPPDAVVELWIADASPENVAAPIVAETTVRPEGRDAEHGNESHFTELGIT